MFDVQVEDDDTTMTPLPIVSSIELVKTASANALPVGSLVTYTFMATNTSNHPLADVAISDPMPGLSELACSTPDESTTLAPLQAMKCTATYRIAGSDGTQVVNTATATGVDVQGTTVSAEDEAIVLVTRSVVVRPTVEPDPEPEPETPPDEVLALVVEAPLAHTGADSRSLTLRALLLIASGAFFMLGSQRRIRRYENGDS